MKLRLKINTSKRLIHSYFKLVFLFGFISNFSFGQSQGNITNLEIQEKYCRGFNQLNILLQGDKSFKEAVFLVESIYSGEVIKFREFDSVIEMLTDLTTYYNKYQRVLKYNQPDSLNYIKNYAIFAILFDTLYTQSIETSFKQKATISFAYLHDDPFAECDWTNMFVSKLLLTGKGNCHSLAYLYKIIADKVGAKCWLALAPNHIYIKNFSQYFGWYNTELTSRSFPTDAWIMASLYIHPDAVRSGLYLDTLSNRQSIALCVLDLAKGYEYQTHNYYDGFILKCCELVLQYHPVNPMALLLKAETLRKVYDMQLKERNIEAPETYKKMEEAYATLAKLHYREMPKEMYLEWVRQMQE